jgi:Patatin-like phospholipase
MTAIGAVRTGQVLPTPTECDIVMKGGITSGVVYPAAVVALSKNYRFRNIGGTSAGAIAAAVTAAAEHGRQTHGGTAFTGLAGIPKWIATAGNLFRLFRPNSSTRPIFTLLTRILDSPPGENKLYAATAAILSWNPALSILAAVPGTLLVVVGIALGFWSALLIGAVLFVALPLALSVWPDLSLP